MPHLRLWQAFTAAPEQGKASVQSWQANAIIIHLLGSKRGTLIPFLLVLEGWVCLWIWNPTNPVSHCLKKVCFSTNRIFKTAHTLIEVLQVFKTFSPLTIFEQIFAMIFVWKIKHKTIGLNRMCEFCRNTCYFFIISRVSNFSTGE